MLKHARIEARIPTQDLSRARRWYAEKLGLEAVEERPGGLRYERAAWFRDSEGNMLGIAEVVP